LRLRRAQPLREALQRYEGLVVERTIRMNGGGADLLCEAAQRRYGVIAGRLNSLLGIERLGVTAQRRIDARDG